MDTNYKVPSNIKRKILFGNISMMTVGGITTVAMFILKQFVIENYIDDPSILKIFDTGLLISIVLSLLLLIVIPLYILLTRKEVTAIERIMKKCGIGERELSIDYENTKPMSKLKVGDLCVYCRSGYMFTVIPKKHVLQVSKDLKVNKQKRVSRAMDGTIKAEKYTISENKRYVVTIRTLYGKTVKLQCSLEKNVDAIIQHFSIYDHIIFGSGKEANKAFKELRKTMLEAEKEKEK